jgi:pilus assembly protein Flp/PilA
VRLLTKFWRDETGATAIEYGLIAAGIALAIIAAVNGLGTRLNSKFSRGAWGLMVRDASKTRLLTMRV